jgi:transcriptional regulator with XRE-family HTH domain
MKELREQRGFTCEQLAEAAGLNRRGVIAMERGERSGNVRSYSAYQRPSGFQRETSSQFSTRSLFRRGCPFARPDADCAPALVLCTALMYHDRKGSGNELSGTR